jgi:hypothetical protein
MRTTSIPETSSSIARSKASLCHRLWAQMIFATTPCSAPGSLSRNSRGTGSSIPPECHSASHPRPSKKSVRNCLTLRSTMGLGVQSARRSISCVARTAPQAETTSPPINANRTGVSRSLARRIPKDALQFPKTGGKSLLLHHFFRWTASRNSRQKSESSRASLSLSDGSEGPPGSVLANDGRIRPRCLSGSDFAAGCLVTDDFISRSYHKTRGGSKPQRGAVARSPSMGVQGRTHPFVGARFDSRRLVGFEPARGMAPYLRRQVVKIASLEISD